MRSFELRTRCFTFLSTIFSPTIFLSSIFSSSFFLAMLIQSTLISAKAMAALGDKVQSIETDRKNLSLERGETRSLLAFRFEELKSDKVKVRQYISAKSGNV